MADLVLEWDGLGISARRIQTNSKSFWAVGVPMPVSELGLLGHRRLLREVATLIGLGLTFKRRGRALAITGILVI